MPWMTYALLTIAAAAAAAAAGWTIGSMRRQRASHWMERIKVGLLLVRTGRVVLSNQSAAELLGVATAEPPVGSDLIEILSSWVLRSCESEEIAHEQLERLQKWAQAEPSLELFVLELGERAFGVRAISAGGEEQLYALEELTATHHAERARRRLIDEAQAEAEQARASKARFFAAASHDLLQPLNAARIYASALTEQSGMSETARDMAERIDQALTSAEEIIDVLVDVAKLDSGATRAEIDEFALKPMLIALCSQMSSIAAPRELRLRMHCGNWLTRSDRRLLRRVLQNLISNALRYTEKGGVLVGVRRRGTDLLIEVWDSGIGIAPQYQQSVFDEFSRISAFSPWGEKGLGLGLAICDRICRLLGHPLTLMSTPGRGSCFRIRVPFGGDLMAAPSGSSALAPPSDHIAGHLTVLCVDDEPEILRSLNLLLSGWEITVLTAANRADALAAFLSRAPDVVLADQQLGQDDLGLELLDALNAGAPSGLIGCALITADRSDSLQQQCQQRGIPLLQKPLKALKLRALMTHFGELKAARDGSLKPPV